MTRALLVLMLGPLLVVLVLVVDRAADDPEPASSTVGPPATPDVELAATTTTAGPSTNDSSISSAATTVAVPSATTGRNVPRTTAPMVRAAESVRISSPTPDRATGPEQVVRAGFARFGPAVAGQAVRVAGCESTGDPTGHRLDPAAVNGEHLGLFQLSGRYHRARAARLGFTWGQMREPGPNVAVAVDLFGEQGWRPWSCGWAA